MSATMNIEDETTNTVFMTMDKNGFNVTSNTNPATPAAGSATMYLSNGQLAYVDSGGNVWPVRNADPVAGDNGFKSWAGDPAGASQAFLLSAGVLYLVRMLVPLGGLISNVAVAITTAGATLTSGQNFLALYGPTGVLLSGTADQTTPFGTAQILTAALTTPQTVASGYVFVGILSNGTTPPTLASFSALKPGNVAIGNAGLSVANSRFLTSGSAQTALPTPVTLGSGSQNVAANIWAAVS